MSNFKQTISEEITLGKNGYKLLQKLGEGGYAKVFLGEFTTSTSAGKPIKLACKIIDSTNANVLSKFLIRELKALIKLSHPHIIQVHSIFRRKSKYFIFMRYAEKGDLLDYIRSNGAIKESLARMWTRQIALAIQYLHILEIAHRDVKCENILITAHNNVKLTDFGFARSTIGRCHTRVKSETYCGSISYISPEILRGLPYDPMISDLWSFGIVIYTTLNAIHPFDSRYPQVLYNDQINRNWKFRSNVVTSLSSEVKNLIECLLEPNPLKRWKIEQVIASDWIAMDSKLKVLNSAEFAALNAAMEEATSIGAMDSLKTNKPRSWSFADRKTHLNRNSLTFFKQYDGGFNLQLIPSNFTGPNL